MIWILILIGLFLILTGEIFGKWMVKRARARKALEHAMVASKNRMDMGGGRIRR